MALSEDEVDELARAPKTTSVDGQTVTERDISDVLDGKQDAEEDVVKSRSKLPIRFANSAPPGAS